MSKPINKVQSLQFKLMELASFNNFDGKQVVEDLKANRNLWKGAIWGRFDYFDLLPLRDIAEGYWNTDTLMILTTKDKVKPLYTLAKLNWSVDEFHTFGNETPQRKWGTDSNGKERWVKQSLWCRYGSSLEPNEVIIRLWWD